jgi:hypothetical protein
MKVAMAPERGGRRGANMSPYQGEVNVPGTVYLLHFTTPFRHAKHYVGWTGRGLESRLEYHRSGRGSRLIRALMLDGGDFVIARLWEGQTRAFERGLHNRGGKARLCPVCKGEGVAA